MIPALLLYSHYTVVAVIIFIPLFECMHVGIGPKPKDSDFSDLLGGNFTSKSDAGPKTLKDMSADSDINNALDPDRAKVNLAFDMDRSI